MEYRFELALCAALERPDRIVSRQLGAAVAVPGSRIVDVCLLDPGPGFAERAAITPDTIPPAAVEAAVGPGTAVPIRDAFDCSPGHARSVVDAAVDVGYLERERREGTDCVRSTARYPTDWVEGLTAIENKPDLGRPGDLESQLRFDVALGLFEELILATGSYVTRAHLNRIPEEVGVWRFDPETGEREVVRRPTALDPTKPGVEIVEEHGLRTEVAVVDAPEKARKRRRIAERAYGKGWRPTPPGCVHASVGDDGRPRCGHFGRVVDPGAECGAACPGFEAAERPGFDLGSLRAERSAWVAEPGGTGPRRQSGLGRFR